MPYKARHALELQNLVSVQMLTNVFSQDVIQLPMVEMELVLAVTLIVLPFFLAVIIVKPTLVIAPLEVVLFLFLMLALPLLIVNIHLGLHGAVVLKLAPVELQLLLELLQHNHQIVELLVEQLFHKPNRVIHKPVLSHVSGHLGDLGAHVQ
jgi:hypothetical protein